MGTSQRGGKLLIWGRRGELLFKNGGSDIPSGRNRGRSTAQSDHKNFKKQGGGKLEHADNLLEPSRTSHTGWGIGVKPTTLGERDDGGVAWNSYRIIRA